MDSQNIEKDENGIDIRDIVSYLVGKLWLIILVTICSAVVALLFTNLFITPTYTSTSKVFLLNKASSNAATTSDWSITKQIVTTAPELLTEDFYEKIAEQLNNDEEFVQKFGTITAKTIKSYMSVTSNDDACVITFTTTSANSELSAVIVNAVVSNFGDYVRTMVGSDAISVEQPLVGKAATSSSNIHPLRNMAAFGVLGAVVILAILVAIFLLDDKIKTPDDIEKQLKLSVLGTIPDIESED